MNATGHIARCSHRWKARNVAKQLKGMVAYEVPPTVDGVYQEGLAVPFEPKVEYVAEQEPYPWCVV